MTIPIPIKCDSVMPEGYINVTEEFELRNKIDLATAAYIAAYNKVLVANQNLTAAHTEWKRCERLEDEAYQERVAAEKRLSALLKLNK